MNFKSNIGLVMYWAWRPAIVLILTIYLQGSLKILSASSNAWPKSITTLLLLRVLSWSLLLVTGRCSSDMLVGFRDKCVLLMAPRAVAWSDVTSSRRLQTWLALSYSSRWAIRVKENYYFFVTTKSAEPNLAKPHCSSRCQLYSPVSVVFLLGCHI
jgi:hypothetical protein